MPAAGAVDTHHHLWDAVENDYPYLRDGSRDRMHGKPLPRRYLIDDFRTDIGPSGITASVHIQCGWNPADPVGETLWLERIAAQYGLPSVIVGHADLTAPDLDRTLGKHMQASKRFRGIRQHVGWHSEPKRRLAARPDLLEHGPWLEGYRRLSALGLTFDLQAFYPQLDAALAVAQANPGSAMILGNSGMPVDRDAASMAAWRAATKRFAAAPNTFVKLGGFAMVDPAWTVAGMQPIVDFLVETFGPSRTMVGSNFPVEGVHRDFTSMWSDIVALLAPCTPEERQEILRGTATRIYRIGA